MPRESIRRRSIQSDVYLILLIVSFLAMTVSTILLYRRVYVAYDFNKDPAVRNVEKGRRRAEALAAIGGTQVSPVPAVFETGVLSGTPAPTGLPDGSGD